MWNKGVYSPGVFVSQGSRAQEPWLLLEASGVPHARTQGDGPIRKVYTCTFLRPM